LLHQRIPVFALIPPIDTPFSPFGAGGGVSMTKYLKGESNNKYKDRYKQNDMDDNRDDNYVHEEGNKKYDIFFFMLYIYIYILALLIPLHILAFLSCTPTTILYIPPPPPPPSLLLLHSPWLVMTNILLLTRMIGTPVFFFSYLII
jgi:hypothetical protein